MYAPRMYVFILCMYGPVVHVTFQNGVSDDVERSAAAIDQSIRSVDLATWGKYHLESLKKW